MSSLMYGRKEKRAAKGITRGNQRRTKHEQYKNSLFQENLHVSLDISLEVMIMNFIPRSLRR